MSFYVRTRLTWLVLIVCSASHLFAGQSSYRPVSPFPVTFLTTVKQVDAGFNLGDLNAKKQARICSCQILSMSSNNYRHDNVVVLAEKVNTGNFSAGSVMAAERIEKEKKHLKLMFYDRLKVIYRSSEATDCKSMFSKLKEQNSSLVLYDILDADIRL